MLNKKKTAIVLVPEISLTPQMVDRFLSRFGDVIAVLHSKLSVGERYDEWQKIKSRKSKNSNWGKICNFCTNRKFRNNYNR